MFHKSVLKFELHWPASLGAGFLYYQFHYPCFTFWAHRDMQF